MSVSRQSCTHSVTHGHSTGDISLLARAHRPRPCLDRAAPTMSMRSTSTHYTACHTRARRSPRYLALPTAPSELRPLNKVQYGCCSSDDTPHAAEYSDNAYAHSNTAPSIMLERPSRSRDQTCSAARAASALRRALGPPALGIGKSAARRVRVSPTWHASSQASSQTPDAHQRTAHQQTAHQDDDYGMARA